MYSHKRKLLVTVGMVAAAIVLIVLTAWPVYADIELLYFRATSSPSTVLLEWATASETNIRGFVIECKKVDEPDEEYHAIGGRDAVGRPDVGAAYSFNIASGLEPGTAYCFRLVETTIDGLPGEQFEICGYGLSLTPTPPLAGGLGGFGDATPAGVIVVPRLDLDETPTPTLTPFAPTGDSDAGDSAAGVATPTPITAVTPATQATTPPVITPAGTPVFPTPTVFVPPVVTPVQPVSPQAGPVQPQSPLVNGEARDTAEDVADDMTEDVDAQSALITPEFTPSPVVTVATAIVETPVVAPDSPLTPSELIPAPQNTPDPDAEDEGAAFLPGVVNQGDADLDATPTPLYLVVTATPTAEAVAIMPTFTPWPTVTPEPATNSATDLWSLLTGSTENFMAQNLMVMLLCLIFLTASGLGTLGLVTSVIYMRSRAQREEHLARLYGRRRF